MGIYDRDYYSEHNIRPLRPWDNKSAVTILIIVNVVVFIANFVFSAGNDALARMLALHPESLTDPRYWWRLVSYGFTHDPHRISHILFNMATLYFLGRSVEDRIGKGEFFRFYMLTLIVCGIVWCGFHQGIQASVIGASGATTAVAMLFVFFYPQATLMLYMAFPVKAWVVGVLIILGNLFQPTGFSGQNGASIAYDIHLVGAAFAAAYFFGKWNFGQFASFFSDLKSKQRRMRSGLKVHRPDSSEINRSDRDALESDRILEKIYREGEESLTASERKFLEQYSRQVRKRRGS